MSGRSAGRRRRVSERAVSASEGGPVEEGDGKATAGAASGGAGGRCRAGAESARTVRPTPASIRTAGEKGAKGWRRRFRSQEDFPGAVWCAMAEDLLTWSDGGRNRFPRPLLLIISA